jgi:CubicO group peptidase (beta-lactamase class C family)
LASDKEYHLKIQKYDEMKNPVMFFFVLFAFWGQYGNAQISSQKVSQLGFELDKVLLEQFKPSEPGCAVLVAHNGKIVYKNGFGMADLAMKLPINADMVFDIGTLTKQLTAVAVMQLVEKGKLSLHDPITRFIDEYPTQGYNITIEHLLTETSGIKDIEGIDSIIGYKDFSPREFINFIKTEKLEFAPGSARSNCNSGYYLLGYIIEKVSGKTCSQYIEENIFKPAGMKNPYADINANQSMNRATGYQKSVNGFDSLKNRTGNAANGLMLNVEDYFNFYQALNSYKLITKESLEISRSNYKLENGKGSGFGFGFEVRNFEGKRVFSQKSSSMGYFASQLYFPEEDIHVVVFTNCSAFIDNDPVQKIFIRAITDVNSSLGFKNSDSTRLFYYHFLFTTKVLPNSGIIPVGYTNSIYINGITQNLHYTTDGSEPTLNSPRYNKKIQLSGPNVLKVKVIPPNAPDTLKSVSYVYTEGVSPEPILTNNGLKPGLKFSYYEGSWNLLPDFNPLKPLLTGITQTPELSMALKNEHFAMLFEGYLYIEKDGLYNIFCISDDGSKVFLNDKLIIDSDGSHGSVPEAYVTPLKKGYYPLRVEYFEGSGGQELHLGYWTEGNEPKPFTGEMLFHDDQIANH